MTNTILSTTNPDWGFWGTINYHADPSEVWPLAMKHIAIATGCPSTSVRDFLDSRHGRHFADDVANGLFDGKTTEPAIEVAIEKWLDWTIDRRTERQTGIPHGLPYLTGFVTSFEIEAEAAN